MTERLGSEHVQAAYREKLRGENANLRASIYAIKNYALAATDPVRSLQHIIRMCIDAERKRGDAGVWYCNRCCKTVDMDAMRCGCAQGPSPWEWMPSAPNDKLCREQGGKDSDASNR